MKRYLCLILCAFFLMSAVDVSAESQAALSISSSSDTLSEGSELVLTFNLKDCEKCKSLALVFDYDTTDVFEIVSGEWLLEETTLARFDKVTTEAGTAAAAYSDETDVNGIIFILKLKVKDNAPLGETTIKVKPTIKNGSKTIECSTESLNVTIERPYVRGDVDNNGSVNSTDAIYLLRHIMLASKYPINQNGDMNGDGEINSSDAIYLLRYVMYPSKYPLS